MRRGNKIDKNIQKGDEIERDQRATTQTSRELLYGLGFPACLRARSVLSRRFVFLFVWPRAIFNIMNPCASGLYKYERTILNITHGRDV